MPRARLEAEMEERRLRCTSVTLRFLVILTASSVAVMQQHKREIRVD
jgi:hypothetical protein